jgi:hypothetical protein
LLVRNAAPEAPRSWAEVTVYASDDAELHVPGDEFLFQIRARGLEGTSAELQRFRRVVSDQKELKGKRLIAVAEFRVGPDDVGARYVDAARRHMAVSPPIR